jgi:predicted RNase H-like HicB family nuclease
MNEIQNEEDTLDSSEEKDTPQTEEVEPTTGETKPEKAEKSKELQTAIAQKEHFRKKYETLLSQTKTEKPAEPVKNEAGDEWQKKVDFLLENPNTPKVVFNHIATVARRDGISYEEAMEKEKEYIQFVNKKVAEQNKIPSPSQSKGKSLYKTAEEISKMTSAEHEAYEKLLDEGDGQI